MSFFVYYDEWVSSPHVSIFCQDEKLFPLFSRQISLFLWRFLTKYQWATGLWMPFRILFKSSENLDSVFKDEVYLSDYPSFEDSLLKIFILRLKNKV